MSLKINNFSIKSFLLGIGAAVALIASIAAVAAVVLHGPIHPHHGQSSSAATPEVMRVRAGIAALDKQWNAEVKAETAKLYAPLHRQHNNSGIRRISDVSYGDDPQQKLDLFAPDQGFDALGPVVVFLHEDAASGDKIVAGTGELLYSNVAKWVARVGGVGINANYRLLPEAQGSVGADDVRMLIDWARNNVSQYGGDPQSIIVMGNGEGATHITSYLFNEASQAASGPGIAGAILASGIFEPATLKLVEGYQGKAVPILMWSAGLDPVETGVTEMKDKLCQKYGSCPMFAQLAEHNHVSAVMSIDSDDTSVTNHIIRFYHSAVLK